MKNNNLLSPEDNVDGLIVYLNQINPYNIEAISDGIVRPVVLEKYKL